MISKVLKCSRAYPLGHFDLWLLPGDWEIFVKNCEKFRDVLAISTEKKYICRYQFPIEFDDMYIYNFFKYGTISETRPRTLSEQSPQKQ